MIPNKSPFFRELGHIVLSAWRPSSRTPTFHDGMCKATTPVVMDRCVTSQWRQEGDVAGFGGDFERILS